MASNDKSVHLFVYSLAASKNALAYLVAANTYLTRFTKGLSEMNLTNRLAADIQVGST